MTTGQQQVYRVVDGHNQGWHPMGGDHRYHADYGHRSGLEPLTLDQITDQRGGWRPVELITDEDADELRRLFAAAGRKTIATLASAVEEVFYRLRESQGGLGAAGSYDYAKRTLTAGRGGSWESELLGGDVVWFGNDLNLAKPSRDDPPGLEAAVNARRARGPSRRVDRQVRDRLVEIVTRWVTGPGRYTEVAETLAEVVSRYADGMYGAAGWARIADQWMQPGTPGHTAAGPLYRLFYSQSAHYDPEAG